MTERTLATLRAVAWEHAKGELRSMLVTYYDDEEEYTALRNAIENFIKQVEDEIGV